VEVVDSTQYGFSTPKNGGLPHAWNAPQSRLQASRTRSSDVEELSIIRRLNPSEIASNDKLSFKLT